MNRITRWIGLCPGEHLGEFYVPIDAGEDVTCPECRRRMILYVRQDAIPTPRRQPQMDDPAGRALARLRKMSE